MRIGHFVPQMIHQGGIATYIRRIGHALSVKGHEVVYLSSANEAASFPAETHHTTSSGHELFEKAERLRIDVLHLHKAVDALPSEHIPTIRTVHGNGAGCPSGSRYLERTGQPCDRTYSVTGCLWGHLVDHCGSRRPQNTLANFQNIRLEHRQAAQVLTLTVSAFLKNQMIRSGCSPDNLEVLHSPAPDVNTGFVPMDTSSPPRFVFAGRLEPKKGVDWLLRAIAKVHVDVRVDIAGSGGNAYLDHLRQLVADLDLSEQITFHGWVEEADVYALIKQARALVFPSVWHEPAGLVTLEAAACGRPVIASEVGGIPEYAMDDFALYVSARDVDGLARHIEHLATHPTRAEDMGRRGWHRARSQFSMDRFIQRLTSFYETAIEHPVPVR